MKSLNVFIDRQTRTFKTRATAQRAFDKAVDGITDDAMADIVKGYSLIVQQSPGLALASIADGPRFQRDSVEARWVVIIVNPASIEAGYWMHNADFAVFGVIG